MILMYSPKKVCKFTLSSFRSERYFFLYGCIRPHSAYRGGVRFSTYIYYWDYYYYYYYYYYY